MSLYILILEKTNWLWLEGELSLSKDSCSFLAIAVILTAGRIQPCIFSYFHGNGDYFKSELSD